MPSKVLTFKQFLIKTFIICVIIVVAITGVLFFVPNYNNNSEIVIKVEKGLFAGYIYDNLYNDKLIISRNLFALYCDITGTTKQLKAGYYTFPKNASIYTINQMMVKGIHPQGKITIIAGMNENEVNELIKSAPYLVKSYLEKEDIGMLFPDTYFYEYGQDSSVIINEAKKKMNRVVDEVWLTRDKRIPLRNKYQMVIVSSILIKEATDQSEFSNVAQVIFNRLKINMHLGMDSVLSYGISEKSINNKSKQTNSRYNTFKYYGLPPTPISFVNRDSLIAAIKYNQDFEYLYFLSANNKMYYAHTYKQHKENINKYLR